MGKFDSPRYDKCREWIQLCTENKTPWEEIRLARKSDVTGLKNFLRTSAEEQFWPELWFISFYLCKREKDTS